LVIVVSMKPGLRETTLMLGYILACTKVKADSAHFDIAVCVYE